MIQPLRNVHRRAFLALSTILPAILVVGLSARHRNMPLRADSVESHDKAEPFKVFLRWQRHSIDTYFYVDVNGERVTEVALNPKRPIDDPDLLLYWVGNEAATADLSQAQLLGPFVAGKSYSLPAGERHGELVLYSLAHRDVIDRARIEELP